MHTSKKVFDFILSFRPHRSEVRELIRRARAHRLGLDFLLKGDVTAVAAIFRTHVFTVENARGLLLRAGGRG